MSKTAPVIIAGAVGILMIVAYFSPPLLPWRQTAEEWYTIVATIAMLLGAVNLCVHHLKKISDTHSHTVCVLSVLAVLTLRVTGESAAVALQNLVRVP